MVLDRCVCEDAAGEKFNWSTLEAAKLVCPLSKHLPQLEKYICPSVMLLWVSYCKILPLLWNAIHTQITFQRYLTGGEKAICHLLTTGFSPLNAASPPPRPHALHAVVGKLQRGLFHLIELCLVSSSAWYIFAAVTNQSIIAPTCFPPTAAALSAKFLFLCPPAATLQHAVLLFFFFNKPYWNYNK